jgi:hypothetical protein
VVLIILGANYQGGIQNEQKQVAKSGHVAPSNRGIIISDQTSSESNGVSHTRSNSRISNQHSNDNHKRISNTGDTLRPSTKPTGGQHQQPKPEPIDNKTTPQNPPQSEPEPPKEEEPAPQPTEPSKPEPEPQPEPVYLLDVSTPIAEVKAVPIKKKKPLIKVIIEVKKNELPNSDRRWSWKSNIREKNPKHSGSGSNQGEHIQQSSSKSPQHRTEKMRIQDSLSGSE